MKQTRRRPRRSKHTRKMNGGADYTKNVSEPWFSLIKLGLKTVEGRLSKGDFKNMKEGDRITFTNEELPFPRAHTVEISHIEEFPTFQAYLAESGLNQCLPGIDTIDQGVKVYYHYFREVDEKEYGVRAIHLKSVSAP